MGERAAGPASTAGPLAGVDPGHPDPRHRELKLRAVGPSDGSLGWLRASAPRREWAARLARSPAGAKPRSRMSRLFGPHRPKEMGRAGPGGRKRVLLAQWGAGPLPTHAVNGPAPFSATTTPRAVISVRPACPDPPAMARSLPANLLVSRCGPAMGARIEPGHFLYNRRNTL